MTPDKNTLAELKIHRPAARSRGVSRTWLVVVAVLMVIGGAVAWWWLRPRAAIVETATAQAVAVGETRTLLNASGYVTARRAATVSSKVTGRVTEVLIEEGMKVEAGQVLARVDDTNIAASMRLAEAQLESSRRALGETDANLDQARRTLRRTSSLADVKGASASELDRATAEVAALEARLQRQRADIAVAERQLDAWRQQLEDTVIRAPFSGIVVSKNAQPGEMISPISAGGGFTRTGICTIVDMSSLEVEVDVSESYINRVHPGQPVVATLDSYPDWHIPAKVITIIPTADRQKATVMVRVGFVELDPRILPDMGLKVAFQSAEASAPAAREVVVPKSAVRRMDGRDVVWVVHDDRVERRAVTIASTNGDEVTLAAGLTGGETVVVAGPEDLADGSRVVSKSL